MGNWTLFRIVTLLTALLMVGEAVALTVGVRLLGQPDNPWVSTKNDLLLALDVVGGLGLAWIAWHAGDGPASPWLWPLLVLALATHGYRDWEYLTGAGNAFLGNAALFVVNNVKVLGFLVAGAVRLL
jgi:hypothetical protein